MSLAGSIVGVGDPVFSRYAKGNRPKPKPSFCPICGALVDSGVDAMGQLEYFRQGYVLKETKPYHAYYCKSLRICFCNDCISGQGGVDIICRVIEATPEMRKAVERDCNVILETRRRERRATLTKWAVGIGVVASIIGICCLIWKPEEVFGVIGILLLLVFVGFLQGACRR